MYCSEAAHALMHTDNYTEKQKTAKLLVECIDNVKFYDSDFHKVIIQLVLADLSRRGIDLDNLLFFHLSQDRLRLVRRDFELRDIIRCSIKYVEENPRTDFARQIKLGTISTSELESRLYLVVAESIARHLFYMEKCLEARQAYRAPVPDLRELARLVPSLLATAAAAKGRARRKASR